MSGLGGALCRPYTWWLGHPAVQLGHALAAWGNNIPGIITIFVGYCENSE